MRLFSWVGCMGEPLAPRAAFESADVVVSIPGAHATSPRRRGPLSRAWGAENRPNCPLANLPHKIPMQKQLLYIFRIREGKWKPARLMRHDYIRRVVPGREDRVRSGYDSYDSGHSRPQARSTALLQLCQIPNCAGNSTLPNRSYCKSPI